MRLRNAFFGIIVVLGVGLIGYGVVVGNQGGYVIEVTGTITESEFEGEKPVIEYDSLPPEIQDAFRKSLDTGEEVTVSANPEFQIAYVHYRGTYYRVVRGVFDARQTTMVFSLLGGVGLVLIGATAWVWSRRRGDREPTDKA